MITYLLMTIAMSNRLSEIDRSEFITTLYQVNQEKVEQTDANYEYSGWNTSEVQEIERQYIFELTNGGMAIGAFHENRLVGFGVLGHRLMGENLDQLHVDLMYVSRDFRRQGIGSVILEMISKEAKIRGAVYLYISSTETESAVSFYRKNGGAITNAVDEILFNKEPEDIHMIKKLY
ncbi:GNAT family N-acetyltransferase [Pedobacter sp. PAMC26386]|nr:GNAT family N-acetyltransferase [Pedobacter sp. PAMC26386]